MQRSVPVSRQAAICLVLSALAAGLTIMVWPVSERFPFAFFLAAVVASAWSCGPAAAIVTTSLCTAALGSIYYWQSPTDGFELVQENLPRLALFLFTGLLTSYLVRECRGAIVAVDRVHVMLGHLGEALITTDAQGRVRYVNEEAQTLTGCDAREAAGKPLGHVLTLLDERTRQPLPQPNQAVMARRVAVDLPAGALLQSARGKALAVEGRAAPIQDGDQIDGVAITFRDVTSRRALDLADHHRLERWQRAAATLPDPVFLKDELGNYVGANAAAAHLVARDPAAIAGAEDAALFSPEVARTIIQADRLAFESGQPQSYQLAVGDGAERRIFSAIKTPVLGPDGKLGGVVDVFHEVTNTASSEENLKRGIRDLERRLEEQASAHKASESRVRHAHEKECAELHKLRQNSEESWNEQLAELRRRLDEKIAELEEARALLAELSQNRSQDIEERLSGDRVAAEQAFTKELNRVKAEHSSHVQNAVQEERQRGDDLMQLAQQEHAQALAEYQAAWESAEHALQQAKNELADLRSRSTQPKENAAVRQERKELIHRLAEQTAARLGLEESLRRAQEKVEEWKTRLAKPPEPDQHKLDEIRNLAAADAAERERKWNEERAEWQHRLDLASREHEQRLSSAQDNWRQTLAEYDRRLTEARDHGVENESLREQLEQSRRDALQARREKEKVAEQLKSLVAVSANGAPLDSRTAYEAWEASAERPNPDWLSFN